MWDKIKSFFSSLVFFKDATIVQYKKEEPIVNIPKEIKVEPPPVKPKPVQKRTRKPKQNGTTKKQSK